MVIEFFTAEKSYFFYIYIYTETHHTVCRPFTTRLQLIKVTNHWAIQFRDCEIGRVKIVEAWSLFLFRSSYNPDLPWRAISTSFLRL